MNKKVLVERRKHKRFKVKDGAFVMFRPQCLRSTMSGRITDISKGGLSFLYLADEECVKGSFELSILVPYRGFNVLNVPAKTVSDFEIPGDGPASSMITRRRSVQFVGLTQNHVSELESFVRDYTVGVRLKAKGERCKA